MRRTVRRPRPWERPWSAQAGTTRVRVVRLARGSAAATDCPRLPGPCPPCSTGLLSVPSITIYGFALANLLMIIGFHTIIGDQLGALYLGIAISVSSTLLVVKLFQEKFELDTVPGRYALALGLCLAAPSFAQDSEPQWMWLEGATTAAFRGHFGCGAVASAVLEITADDAYEVYLDGRRLGGDGRWQTASMSALPGCTNTPTRRSGVLAPRSNVHTTSVAMPYATLTM